ncbi:MAG: hypothetical protein HC778_02535 [Chamaesiphon sp. CSU_1_12]|nr:hypothetical protein [Chamaesiphon sp. CSU_1_12]
MWDSANVGQASSLSPLVQVQEIGCASRKPRLARRDSLGARRLGLIPLVSEKCAAPSLSNAEWEIMKTLWSRGPLAARDVYAALPKGHGWAVNTVKTRMFHARRKLREALPELSGWASSLSEGS